MRRAGNRRTLVTLQQPDSTAAGGFADVDRVWAELVFKPASGVALVSGGPMAGTAHQARIPFRDDMRSGWRMTTSDDRQFEVAGYGDPDGRRRELLLVCTEAQ